MTLLGGEAMEKIAVIGCCGGGKSVLTKKLSKIWGIPAYHLDDLFWHEGWIGTEHEDWQRINRELVENKRWIIDGTYSSCLEIRMKNADLIIFVDLPLWLCFFRVIKRQIRNFLGWEKSLPARIQKANESSSKTYLSDWDFYRYVLTFKRNFNPLIHELAGQLEENQKIIRLSSTREIDVFLDKVKHEQKTEPTTVTR